MNLTDIRWRLVCVNAAFWFAVLVIVLALVGVLS